MLASILCNRGCSRHGIALCGQFYLYFCLRAAAVREAMHLHAKALLMKIGLLNYYAHGRHSSVPGPLWTLATITCRSVVHEPSMVAPALQLCLADLELLETFLSHAKIWCLVRLCHAGSSLRALSKKTTLHV